jgi:hypothetical protein
MPNNSPLSTLNSPLKREQQNLEWKEFWRDDYLRWICGFANADGGVLVIGRNDRGQPVGVANAARLLEEIPNKVRDVLGIMVAVNLRVRRRQGVGRDSRRSLPQPGELQGRVSLPQRQHQTGTERCGAVALFAQETRAALGCHGAARAEGGRAGCRRTAPVSPAGLAQPAFARGRIARVGRAAAGAAALAGRRCMQTRDGAAVSFPAQPLVYRRLCEDRFFRERCRSALSG